MGDDRDPLRRRGSCRIGKSLKSRQLACSAVGSAFWPRGHLAMRRVGRPSCRPWKRPQRPRQATRPGPTGSCHNMPSYRFARFSRGKMNRSPPAPRHYSGWRSRPWRALTPLPSHPALSAIDSTNHVFCNIGPLYIVETPGIRKVANLASRPAPSRSRLRKARYRAAPREGVEYVPS